MVLLTSYTEGDWHMLTLYQNFMTIVQHFSKPTLFVTITVNFKWSEIINALLSGITAQNDSALIATIFILKKKTLLTDLKTLFRTYQSVSWTVKYQKHRLSHCYILLFFTAQDHTLNAGWIDNYIQAEFPESALNPDGKLTEIMKEIMMHSSCGELNSSSSCMKLDKYDCTVCSKKYSW